MDENYKIIEQVQEILRKKSLDGFEIFFTQSSHFDIESKDQKIETLKTSKYFGIALRILNQHRLGFSYTTLPNPSLSSGRSFFMKLDQIIEEAVESSRETSPDPYLDFSPPIGGLLPQLDIFDDQLGKISERVKIEKAKELERLVRSVAPEKIKKVRKATYQDSLFKTTLINSKGLFFSYDHSLASVSVTAVAEQGGESEMGWEFDVSHFFHDLNIEKVAQSAGGKALNRLGGKRIPSGVYPVILDNQVASEFLSLLAHSFLADQVHKGKSPLRGRKGERFFSPLLNIVDDGLYPKGISTSPIDGEGMPSQRTPLVVQGEIRGFLYDLYWANRENQTSADSQVKSTGNSRRHGINSPPGIGISNIFIQPGDCPMAKLLEDLSQGIVVDEIMGLHTVDPISGDFSLGCSGDWIERGERVYPVKSIAIAGNLFELFQKVIGVGNDLRFFGGVGSPSLLIRELSISGS